MTTASEFRARVIGAVPIAESAALIGVLPDGAFERALMALTEFRLLANTLSWMTEPQRLRALLALPYLTVREAHTRISRDCVARMKDTPSWALWQKIAEIKDFEIEAWARELAVLGPENAHRLWNSLDAPSRARVALAMTDEQLETLLEQLK